MDLIDKLREISVRIPKLKEGELIKTEEGTKNALVMPFINALGYNVFDPMEVTPELVADVGTKKGEKVDYAILKDSKPIMLFECKCCGVDLNHVHASQLYRYFSVTASRFGVLTDGVIYRFYSDLDRPNIMDKEPFFIFDMLSFKDTDVEELKKFTKSAFDMERIITTASELKYKNLMRVWLNAQLAQPSEALVRLVLHDSGVFTGRFIQSVIDEYTPLVRDSLRLFVNEQVDNRLKSALEKEEEPETPPVVEVVPAGEALITTTPEENDAFLIVRAILREVVDVKRVSIRDQQTYCGILLDNNNRKPIIRLHFNYSKKYISTFDDQKQEHKIAITSIDDIYQHADAIKATALRHLTPA